MKKAVFCIVKSQNQADQITNDLQRAGFASRDISVILPESVAGSPEGTTAAPRGAGKVGHEKHTKAPEGAAIGAVSGGVIGGALGLLAGLGTIAIPGLGAFVAAGPIMAALSGSAVGGGAGLLVGALAGLGIPEYEAKRYQDALQNGGILLSVHAGNSDQCDKAKKIFEKDGARDISSTSEKASSKR